jgi:hypothetical protein
MKPDSARRRLMRGAFAAPAVLTLHSGGALAATSSRCEARVSQNVALVTGSADTYLRYQLYALRKSNGNNEIDSYWIQGSDLKTLKIDATTGLVFSQGFHPTSGEWQQYSKSTNTLTGALLYAQPVQPVNNNGNTGNWEWVRVNEYVVLRVDKDGVVVGVGSGTGNDFVVTGSCASSLVAALTFR